MTVNSLVFCRIVKDVLGDSLGDLGYLFREDIADLDPMEIPEDVYLPFTKMISRDEYIHIIIEHSFVHDELKQHLKVLLLRYGGFEPWASRAMPVAGKSIQNIVGYLPSKYDNPLPLIRQRNIDSQWFFGKDEELYSNMQIVRDTLLKIILPWMELQDSTQFIHIKKDMYLEPFRKYIEGVYSAGEAYNYINQFKKSGYWVDADNVEETYLVNEVSRIIFQLSLQNPINRPEDLLLYYLLDCLQGNMDFSLADYRKKIDFIRERNKNKRI